MIGKMMRTIHFYGLNKVFHSTLPGGYQVLLGSLLAMLIEYDTWNIFIETKKNGFCLWAEKGIVKATNVIFLLMIENRIVSDSWKWEMNFLSGN